MIFHTKTETQRVQKSKIHANIEVLLAKLQGKEKENSVMYAIQLKIRIIAQHNRHTESIQRCENDFPRKEVDKLLAIF